MERVKGREQEMRYAGMEQRSFEPMLADDRIVGNPILSLQSLSYCSPSPYTRSNKVEA